MSLEDLLDAGDDLARAAEAARADLRWIAKYRLTAAEREKTRSLVGDLEIARGRWEERRRMAAS